MITMTRSLAKRLRAVFSRGLGITARTAGPPIEFCQRSDGLSVRTQNDNFAIEYRESGEYSEESFAAPFEILREIEGSRDQPVNITRQKKTILARWVDGGVPQAAKFRVVAPGKFPPPPAELAANDGSLLTALRDAIATTDDAAIRYALGCVRLRGRDGQVAATDGCQLLLHDGFDFPWQGEILVPANKVLTNPDLVAASLEVGKTDAWFMLRIGNWSIYLRINQDGRFPSVDDHVPDGTHGNTTLRLADDDARYFADALQQLPAADDLGSPITVDLNGKVAIRSKGESDPQPTELVLSSSSHEGPDIRFNTNRKYLARAVQLGFREVQLRSAEAPACCRDDRRTYLWALLGKEGAIKPSRKSNRIESPAVGSEPTQHEHQQEEISPMPTNRTSQTNGHDSNGQQKQNGSTETVSIDALIEAAEGVKASLRESAAQVTELVAALKRHRRQSKSLQSALSSIRQLQSLDV